MNDFFNLRQENSQTNKKFGSQKNTKFSKISIFTGPVILLGEFSSLLSGGT